MLPEVAWGLGSVAGLAFILALKGHLGVYCRDTLGSFCQRLEQERKTVIQGEVTSLPGTPWPVSVSVALVTPPHTLCSGLRKDGRWGSEAHGTFLCPFERFGHCELRDYYLYADGETEAGEGVAVWPRSHGVN